MMKNGSSAKQSEPCALTLNDVYRARYVLSQVIRNTDLIEAPKLNENCWIFLKPENLQVTGSFKVRGAYYKISQLTEEEKSHGVIACSAGNHAQGVALGATACGIKSLICLPEGAPISKVEATRRYGAEICLVPGVYDDAYQKALELKEKCGYTFVHPFNDANVIAGQGTIGLEILDQLSDVDVVLVPVGGGGLISGVAFAMKSLNPHIKVYGVQAAGAPSMKESLETDQIICLDKVHTIADGIAVKKPGELTYELCKQYVDGILTVSDAEVSAAILALIEQQKMIAEGAGAVSVAAAMFNKVDLTGKKVVCIVSGGNIDVNILSRVITRGLSVGGRSARFVFELDDKPGQLVGIAKIIADLGGNVISVDHSRSREDVDITACQMSIRVETRNHEHIRQIKDALTAAGFRMI